MDAVSCEVLGTMPVVFEGKLLLLVNAIKCMGDGLCFGIKK